MTMMRGGAIGDIDLGLGIVRGIRGRDQAHEAMNDGGTMIGIRDSGERGVTRHHGEGEIIQKMGVIEATIEDAKLHEQSYSHYGYRHEQGNIRVAF